MNPEPGIPGRQRAWLGLGSNLPGRLGGPADYVEAALQRLSTADGIELLRRSSLYRSAPWGETAQGDFINAVAEFSSDLSAGELLDTMLAIESELGRRRGGKWGPRLIDLDLLCFDDLEVETMQLTLPHPRMHQRAFVLIPLLELDPDFVIPGRGRADQCLAELGDSQRVERV